MKLPKRHTIPTVVSLLGSATLAFGGSYKVQSGDTLWRISRKHKVSVEEIQKANHLPDFTIELGQVLVIPEKRKATSGGVAPQVKQSVKSKPAIATSDKPTLIKAVSHRVVHGESLWNIAQKYNTTIEILQKRNQLKTNVLETGQILLIAPPRLASSPQQNNNEQENLEAVGKTPSLTSQNKTPKTASKAIVVEDAVNNSKSKSDPVSPVSKGNGAVAGNTPTRELEEVPMINPLDPLPPVPVVIETPTQKGLKLLSSKQGKAVRQQILLDRNGMGPGIIDGYPGNFTKTSLILAKKSRPNTFTGDTALFVETEIPKAVHLYINKDLPGTGKRPDFKQATADQCLMMYKSALEMLAERYHSSEKLLEKLNPELDFNNILVGSKILVPTVTEFKIEEFMTPAGEAINYRYTRNSRRATHVDVDYLQNRIMVWYNSGSEGAKDELLASFPVTTNIKKGPKYQRTIAYFAPAPSYMRKKTELKLKPGPNSPVGIVWAKLGDGFGIHGTSDGSGNGYNTSSGCIRLSNWDMAIFVKIVPSKTKVNFITGANTAQKVSKKAEPTTANITQP